MRNILVVMMIAFCYINSNAQNGKRIALVIGNAEYLHGNSLKNPVNDAELMARTLKGLNFKVIKKINATRKQMSKAIVEFSQKIKDYEAALFYYAGHGIQVDGVNYVIPVDAKIEEPMAVKFEALDVGNIVSQFEYYSDHANIVILDACRDNPFLAWVRGALNSFAPIKAPRGTFVAFSTGSGSVALDNIKGKNGLYTGVLSEELLKSQRIEDVFINTRNKVYDLSKGKQQPQEWSQLSGTFYFTKENVVIENAEDFKNDTTVKSSKRSLSENEFVGLRKGVFQDPEDKMKYKWVKIGPHIWMAENSKKFIDSTNSFYYKNSEVVGKELGYLYTWDGAQKACPTGWHLPSVSEWRKMVLYLGMDMKVGQHLKSDIDPYSSDFYWRWAEKATSPDNSSGFSALYSGCRSDKSKFYMGYASTGFWTSSEMENNHGKAYFYLIPSTFDKVYYTSANKNYGFSVRCVKDN